MILRRWVLASVSGSLVAMLATVPASGQDSPPRPTEPAVHHEHHHHPEPDVAAAAERAVGVDERLAGPVPVDLVFTDERGREKRLGDLLGLPTLVLPIFYHCTQACSVMLGNLASGINRIPLDLGKEYRVLAFSFDDEEGPEIASESKQNYAKILQPGRPAEAWAFLTGERQAVQAFTDAIGFRFKKTGTHSFVHPNVLVVLAPDGTIIRYLYGPRFLPFDMGMALSEAARGTPGVSVRKLLTFCFDYDPENKSYVFNSFRISALVIIVALAGFFFFLLRKRPPA
jgi:protein SCO1/2